MWHAPFYCAVTVAGVAGKKNDVSFLYEASGGPSSFLVAFFLPLLLGFFLICVAPGLRPDRHPPLSPPAARPLRHYIWGTQRVFREIPKRANPQMTSKVLLHGPVVSAFENGAWWYLLNRKLMISSTVNRFSVINQMALGNVWGTTHP